MNTPGHRRCPVLRWALGLLLLGSSPAAHAGEPPDGPSRGEDNRTERGNEALTGAGAWTGTLTGPSTPSASIGAVPQSPVAGRPRVAASKKPRVRVRRTAAARRARPETAHQTLNFEQIRRAVHATIKGSN